MSGSLEGEFPLPERKKRDPGLETTGNPVNVGWEAGLSVPA